MQKFLYIARVLLCGILFFLFAENSFSQREAIKGRPSQRNSDPFANEIQNVEFEGNSAFTDDDLLGVIESRVSLNFIQRFLRYYAEGVRRNPSVPTQIKRAFQKQLEALQGQIFYFNPKIATEDASAIKEFYSLNGYHYADVYYSFALDSAENLRTLTFYIDEKKPAKIDTIVYLGLDSLPGPVREKIFSSHLVKLGEIYSEANIQKDIISSYRVLQDSGYYYSLYQQPKVVVNSAELLDSVTILFSTGKRQKVCDIFFTDSTDGQKGVAFGIRRGMLEFEEGEWFNRSKLQRSINNLYELNTFDIVSIDTSSQHQAMTDTCLSFAVLTKQRKLQEFNAALPIFSETAFDKYKNMGAEFSYTHRNIFGAADPVTVFLRPQLLDITRRSANPFSTDADLELQAGFNYFHPLIGTWWKSRISFSFPYTYSYRYVVNPLRLESHIFKPTLTFRPGPDFDLFGLFNFNSVTSFTLDMTLESQKPRNFARAQTEALQKAEDEAQKKSVLEVLQIYRSLNNYRPAFTALIFGFYPIVDLRDNIFSPHTGALITLGLEYAPGYLVPFTDFIKFQGLWTNFWPWSKQLTYATKVRAGNIWWFGDRRNTYIAFERHFFAGGGNSVRGWASRQLRDPNTGGADTLQGDLSVLSQLVGSATLIEGSSEWRYRFPYYRSLGPTWADVVSSLGITGFIDAGNVYNRLTPNDYGKLWNDMSQLWKGLAVAAGFGIRYETPVGPLRIDLGTKIKDPFRDKNNVANQWHFDIKKWQLHIGLGHAF